MNPVNRPHIGKRTTRTAAMLALAGAATSAASAGLFDFTTNWLAPSSLQWQNGAAWSNGVPQNTPGLNSYTVNITAPGAAYNVILDNNNNWTVTNINVNSSSARLLSTTGSLTVTNSASFTNGRYTVGDFLTLQSGGTIGSGFDFDGGGSINITGGILRNDGVIAASAGSTLNITGTLDLDGNSGDGQLQAVQTTGGGVSIGSALADAYDGAATLREDNTFTFLSGWTLGSAGSLTFTVNSTNNTDALVTGGTFSSGGSLTVNSDVNARIAAPFTMTGGSISIGSAGELELDGATTFSGGSVSGAGTLRTDGDIDVTGLVNIAPTVFDWDGGSGTGHDTSITGIMNIDADRIDGGTTSGDGYDGNVSISGNGVLDVDIAGTFWRLDGTMTLATSNSFSAVNGDEVRVFGTLTSTNAARVDAPVRVESSGSVVVGSGDLIDFHGTHTSAGGSYTGAGTMRMTANWDVLSNTTIDVGTLDWDGVVATGALTRLLNGADLVVNSSINDPMDNDVEISNGSILTLNQGASQFTMGGDFDLLGGTVNGNAAELNMVGDVVGFGDVDLKFDGSASSDIIATGDLSIGRSSVAFGFDHEGTLSVGAHDVLVRSGNQSFLGSMTTIAGGSLAGTVTVQLDSGDVLQGFGDVGRIANGTGGTINATGTLALGSFSSTLGYGGGGTLNAGSHAVTLRDSNGADLGAMTTIAGGSITAVNGMGTGAGETLSGFGTIRGDFGNGGTISATSTGLVFDDGTLLGTGQSTGGTRITFGSNGGFEGAGLIDAQVFGDAGSVIEATGDLTLGRSSVAFGFDHDGTLSVGAHDVVVRSGNQSFLGSMTTIAGGTLNGTVTVQLDSGDVLEGFGDVGRIANGTGGTINATGTLALGSFGSTLGYGGGGTLNIGSNAVTLRDANSADLGAMTTIGGGSLTAQNGVSIGVGETLSGSGAINADVFNSGAINATGVGLTFNGALNGTGTDSSGTRFSFSSTGSFEGSGLIDAQVVGSAGSVLTATGALDLGRTTDTVGFTTSGELHVGSHTVRLLDSNAVQLGSMTTVSGGTLRTLGAALPAFQLGSGDVLSGFGTVDGDIAGSAGSTITATGDLALGRATSSLGFSHAGGLNVNGSTVTLLDSGLAALGVDTFLDNGTLAAANGVSVGVGDTVRGNGTIDADITNAGTILAQNAGLTINGVLSGTGESTSGTRITFGSTGGFTGDGVIDARVLAAVGSTITATGDLTIGVASDADGFNSGGTLDVGSHTVTLLDANLVGLGSLTSLDGGTLIAANGVTTNGADVIAGVGTIETNAQVRNDGVVRPGMSAGLLTIDGDFANRSPGLVEMEIGGTGAGQHDRLVITGDASLDGTLGVSLIDSFNPDWGDEFSIMSYATVAGDFATLDLPSLDAGLFWWTDVTATEYLLGVRTAADTNHDGTVDFADLNNVIAAFNTSGMGILGDANEDGTVDFGDLNLVLAAFNTSAPSNLVPTPGAATLLGLAIAALARRRRTA